MDGLFSHTPPASFVFSLFSYEPFLDASTHCRPFHTTANTDRRDTQLHPQERRDFLEALFLGLSEALELARHQVLDRAR